MHGDANPEPRFRAFISYSHADARVARWLHAAIEGFRIPARLVGTLGPEGPVPRRLMPVFIDRGELAASASLSAELQAAMAASRFLIVVCTPATPRSLWVDKEITQFKMVHGEDRVLALIAAGVPGASAIPGREQEECFPPSLRFIVDAKGERTTELAEPLAADLRREGDGRRLALLKLIATLAGTRLDDLVQREAQRRVRRLTVVAAASVAGMVITGGLAVYANQQRLQAVQQTATANAAVDYLVGIFDIVDSGRENPQTVTAASLLRHSAEKAQTALNGQPLIMARIADTIGRIYLNLGLYADSAATLTRVRPLLESLGPDGAPALVTLAQSRLKLGDLRAASAVLADVRAGFTPGTPPLLVKARVAQVAGRIAVAEANQDRALELYTEAEALLRRAPDVKPEAIAEIAVNRGVLLTDMARFDEAETALLSGNAIYRRALGDTHRLTGVSYNALAYNEFSAKRYALAAVNIAKAETVLGRVLDTDNPTLAAAMSLRGQIEQQAGHPAAAKAAIQRALAIYHKRFGEHHYLIGVALVSLALVDADLGDYKSALADFDTAKINYDIAYGHMHANHGDLKVNRATVLARMGRTAEAQADCSAGMAILARTLGPKAGYTLEMAKICAKLPAAPARISAAA